MPCPRLSVLSWHHLAVLVAAMTFFVDVQLPRGVAVGIPYILIVLLALRAKRARAALTVATACTALAVVGFVLSPPGVTAASGLINRALTVLGIWVVAVLAVRHRQQRDRLHQSEARAQAIVEACGDGIITFDQEGQVLSANPAAGRIFGRPPEEIASGRLDDVLPSAVSQGDGAPAGRGLASHGAGPAEVCSETLGLRADGSFFPVEVATSSGEIDDRRVFTAVIREVTRRRVVEREALRLGEEGRWRIGHELHEGLGQALTGTGLLAGQLARQLQASGDPRADDALRVVEAVREADQQAKDLALALVPVELDAEGLHVALQRLARRIERESHARCSVQLHGEGGPEDRLAASVFYQIMQRAALQAVHERAATRITLTLKREAGRACGSVEHDGKEEPGRADADSSLLVMQHWARLIGAQVNTTARPEGGVLTVALNDASEPRLQPVRATGGGLPPVDREAIPGSSTA